MEWFWTFLLFIFGLCVGSFINCLVYRLNLSPSPVSQPRQFPNPSGLGFSTRRVFPWRGFSLASLQRILGSRSYCDHCKKQLVWFDNIPLLSFILLKGKCRYCGKPISWQYPLVELGTGIIFSMWYVVYSIGGIRDIGEMVFFLFVSSALIVIFVSDWKYQIIPDQVIYPAIGATLLYLFLKYSILYTLYSILLALCAAGFFLLLYFITKRKGMGLGDVKLAFLMGLLLGWPHILVALYFAFLTGALAGAILILAGRKKFGQHIPFGPFLVTGTFVAWFFGERILSHLSYLGYL